MPSTASTPEWHYISVVPLPGPYWPGMELQDPLLDLFGRAGPSMAGSDTSKGHATAHGSARHYVPLGTHRPLSQRWLVSSLGGPYTMTMTVVQQTCGEGVFSVI